MTVGLGPGILAEELSDIPGTGGVAWAKWADLDITSLEENPQFEGFYVHMLLIVSSG